MTATLRQWYGHFAGIALPWLRLAAPGGLLAAWLAHSLWPLLLALPIAAVYAAGHVALRLRPPRLERLKAADAGLLLGSAVAGTSVVAPLLSPWPWLLLPAVTLVGGTWIFNWRHGGRAAPAVKGTPPVFVPPARGPVTAAWQGYDRSHSGVDLGLPCGTPVVAPAAGTVRHAGPQGHWGYCLELDHGDGWTTLLAHLERTLVRRGDVVAAGQRVGLSGTSGISTGPHLHVELRAHGMPVDPAPLLGPAD